MSFTYINNIPATNNNPSNDQPNMQTNTNTINNWVQVDHIGFNTANGGQHSKVTFPDAVSPVPTATGDAGVLFTEIVSSVAQLFFVNSATKTQLTGLEVSVTTNSGTAGPGSNIYAIDFQNGIRIYCGIASSVTGNGKTIVFPVAYTTGYTTICSSASANSTPITVGCNFSVGNIGISISVATGTVGICWMAIGTIL